VCRPLQSRFFKVLREDVGDDRGYWKPYILQ
jgi:hypothetical protein